MDTVTEVLKMLNDGNINTTHFVTLVYRKWVNENDCDTGYKKFLRMLNRRIYGKHSKRIRLKQLGFLETNFNGYFGVHILLDVDGVEVEKFKSEIKDLWCNYVKVNGRRIGSFETFGNKFFKKDFTGWWLDVYDLNGIVGYVTKNLGKRDFKTGSDKCMLVGL